MDTFANNPAGTYARFIAACNERRFNDLGEFIATDVEGVRSGFVGYRDGLRDITVAFPDFHWHIEELIVEGLSMAGSADGHRYPPWWVRRDRPDRSACADPRARGVPGRQ